MWLSFSALLNVDNAFLASSSEKMRILLMSRCTLVSNVLSTAVTHGDFGAKVKTK
jgi:hypothetical protein